MDDLSVPANKRPLTSHAKNKRRPSGLIKPPGTPFFRYLKHVLHPVHSLLVHPNTLTFHTFKARRLLYDLMLVIHPAERRILSLPKLNYLIMA